MYKLFPLVLLVFSFVMIFIQDIKHREVHVFYFLTVFVASILLFFFNPSVTYKDIMYNVLFLSCCFGFLVVYTRIRKLDVKGDMQDLIGGMALGDVLLFLLITPLFRFENFILFFVLGLVFTLIVHLLVISFGGKNPLVPLAGYFSLYSIPIVIYQYLQNPIFR